MKADCSSPSDAAPRETVGRSEWMTLIALFALIWLAGCAGHAARPNCDARPGLALSVAVHDQDDKTLWLFASRARVDRIRGDVERFIYDITDDRGELHRIVYQGPTAFPGVEVGREYTWNAEYIGGWPTSSSITVSDEHGLLFAAVADLGVGERVLRSGVPGFQIRLLPPTCGARQSDSCTEGVTNLPLEFIHAGQRIVLYHGQTATLGNYELRVLAAQTQGTGTGRCVDAGVNNVSFTIQRAGVAAFAVPR